MLMIFGDHWMIEMKEEVEKDPSNEAKFKKL
jgi:hypothetical protein